MDPTYKGKQRAVEPSTVEEELSDQTVVWIEEASVVSSILFEAALAGEDITDIQKRLWTGKAAHNLLQSTIPITKRDQEQFSVLREKYGKVDKAPQWVEDRKVEHQEYKKKTNSNMTLRQYASIVEMAHSRPKLEHDGRTSNDAQDRIIKEIEKDRAEGGVSWMQPWNNPKIVAIMSGTEDLLEEVKDLLSGV